MAGVTGRPSAPRGATAGEARVLSDITGSDRMAEARQRRERALAVGTPANISAPSPAAEPAVAATPAAAIPVKPARRLLDGALVALMFLLGAALFAPIAGYAALGKLPFEFGFFSEPGPEIGLIDGIQAAPSLTAEPGQIPPMALAAGGGTRPPQPPSLPATTGQDRTPLIAVAGSIFATALTAAPAMANPDQPELDFQATTATRAARPEFQGLVARTTPASLPDIQSAIIEANVFVHAPASGQTAAAAAVSVLRSAGLDPALTAPVRFGISQNNVRYFYARDRAAAAEVARLLGAELRDFTDFRPSPREGTVEVWIAGAPSADQQPEIPLVSFSTLPVPEALAPLPQDTRRSNVFSRLFSASNQPTRDTLRRKRDDNDDDRRSDRSSAAQSTSTPEASDDTDDGEDAPADESDAGSDAGTEDETTSDDNGDTGGSDSGSGSDEDAGGSDDGDSGSVDDEDGDDDDDDDDDDDEDDDDD